MQGAMRGALCALLLATGASAGGKTFEGEGRQVQVSSKGECSMGRSSEGGIDDTDAGMTVKIVAILERDEDFEIVGENAIEPHTLHGNDIEDLDFVAVGPEDFYYQGLLTSNVNLTATVFSMDDGDTTLQIQSYLFLEAGQVTAGDEYTEVTNGSFKLTFAVNNWPFCAASSTSDSYTHCLDDDNNEEVGAYLDLLFTVKGPNQQSDNADDRKGPESGGLSEKEDAKREDEQQQGGQGGGKDGSQSGKQNDKNNRKLERALGSTTDTKKQGEGGPPPEGAERPKGYCFTNSSADSQSLLDVSDYFWSSDHGWKKLPGGCNYTLPESKEHALFTARMNASSGTLLYDPTVSIVSTSSLEPNTGGDDDDASGAFSGTPGTLVILTALLAAAVHLFV